MKKITLLIIEILIFRNSIFSQSRFQHLLGGPDHERAQTMLSTFDNGYLVNSATFSFGSGNVDVMLIKLDNAGQIIWSKTYGSSSYDNAEYAIETFDHNIVCAGRSNATGSSQTSATIFKTDSAGNLLWNKSFGGTGNDGFSKVIETSDHGYAAVGYSKTLSSGLSDIFFIRTDQNGDTLFTRSFGTIEDEGGTDLIQLPDSGFLVSGRQTTVFGGLTVADGLLLRLDASGNLLWSKMYGDSLFEEFTAVVQTPDNGFMLCGSMASYGFGGYDILLMKTDSSGNPLWTKNYGGVRSDAAYDIHQIAGDSTYVISGYTESFGHGHRVNDSTNIFLMKTDASGNLIWMMTYGDGLQDEAYHSNKANDGGFLISGFTYSYLLTDSSEILIIKTDSVGFTGCHEVSVQPPDSSISFPMPTVNINTSSGIQFSNITFTVLAVNPSDNDACLFSAIQSSPQKENEISVFPNPFTDQIKIRNNISMGDLQLVITDLLGQPVKNMEIIQGENTVEVSQLPAGIYTFNIFSAERIIQKQIIKVMQ